MAANGSSGAGKGDRNRSLTDAYRRGWEYVFRSRATRRDLLDLTCSIDDEGLQLAIEKTRRENEEYFKRQEEER